MIPAGVTVTANGAWQDVAAASGETGTLNLNGTFSTDSDFNLGDNGGTGTVNVAAGAVLNTGNLYVGKGGTAAAVGTFAQMAARSPPASSTSARSTATATATAGARGTYTLGSSVGSTASLAANSVVDVSDQRDEQRPRLLDLQLQRRHPQAPASGTQFFEGLYTARVQAGGAVIDTSGFNVTVNQTLIHVLASPPTGGLTKKGAGTLTLTGLNTHNGGTSVQAGNAALGRPQLHTPTRSAPETSRWPAARCRSRGRSPPSPARPTRRGWLAGYYNVTPSNVSNANQFRRPDHPQRPSGRAYPDGDCATAAGSKLDLNYSNSNYANPGVAPFGPTTDATHANYGFGNATTTSSR